VGRQIIKTIGKTRHVCDKYKEGKNKAGKRSKKKLWVEEG